MSSIAIAIVVCMARKGYAVIACVVFLLGGCRQRSASIEPPPAVHARTSHGKRHKKRHRSPVSVAPESEPSKEEGMASVTAGLEVHKSAFVSDLGPIFKESVRKLAPVDFQTGEYEVGSVESEVSPTFAKACESAIETKFKDPSYDGAYTIDLWEQDEAPAPGEISSFYKLMEAVVPVAVPGERDEVHCFRITVAQATETGTLEASFEKTLSLFLSQDPSSDNTWEGGDAHADKTELTGRSDFERLKTWLRDSLTRRLFGVRWSEIIGKRSDGDSIQFTRDKVRAVVLKISG